MDSSGNVWVASQGCDDIFEYKPSTGTWSTCSLGIMPWYISLDNTNKQVWIAAHNVGSAGNVIDLAMSSCNTSGTGLPSGDKAPIGIDLDGYDVYVTFPAQGTIGTNTIDDYSFAVFGWLCGPASYPSGVPIGISHDQYGNYWAALNGGSELTYGLC